MLALPARIARILQRPSYTMTIKNPLNIPSTVKIEEENIPGYKAQHFYPVRIGQTFMGKYQVLGKLGCGGTSTVWLAHDKSK